MTWHTTKVNRLDQLESELQRLSDASHTIVNQIIVDGYIVIISTTA